MNKFKDKFINYTYPSKVFRLVIFCIIMARLYKTFKVTLFAFAFAFKCIFLSIMSTFLEFPIVSNRLKVLCNTMVLQYLYFMKLSSLKDRMTIKD